jgi:hypothetical protein
MKIKTFMIIPLPAVCNLQAQDTTKTSKKRVEGYFTLSHNKVEILL